MKKKLTTVDFRGTAEQEAKLLEVIAKYDGVQGKMMPILQEAQEIYGYLPIEGQRHIALKMDKPIAEVYGVSTFYSQFVLNPKGDVAIAVCMGTACYVKGSGKLLDKLQEELGIGVGETTADGLFTIEACRCVGACGLAPVVTVNDKVYGHLKPEDITKMIADFKAAAMHT